MSELEGYPPAEPFGLSVTPGPVTPAPLPAAAAAEPEPEKYVVVDFDEVDQYRSKGYRLGYVMIRP